MLGLFGFGNIIYVTLLLLNAVSILSEERFLVPLGLSASSPSAASTSAYGGGYGGGFDNYGTPNASEGPGMKERMITLVAAIRTVMRSELVCSSCERATRILLIPDLVIFSSPDTAQCGRDCIRALAGFFVKIVC